MAPSWHKSADASKSKFEPCEADDPNRCQSVIKHGQCHYLAVPGSEYCMRHGGGKVEAREQRENLSNYRLLKWKTRLDEMRNSTNIKSLRDEIGITRIIIEETINKCKDSHELLLHSSQLNQLIITMEKLVKSCQILEEKNAYLLDKDQLFVIIDCITQIISEHVTDPDVMNEIGTKIYATITASASEQTEGKSPT